MLIDTLIVIFLISAFFRGREIGFVRQAFSSTGFFGGLLIGSYLQPHTITLVHSATGRSLVTLLTTIGCALVLLIVGEYIGIALKRRALQHSWNAFDNSLGAVLGILTFLLTVWLSANILSALPFVSVQQAVKASRIVSKLDQVLPPAPNIIADLSRLIDPNGFPQVFIGGEPAGRQKDVPLPDLGQLQAAVHKDKAAVVKVEGQGCGGIVEGSGFVIGSGLVATNAHVIAGIKHPYVQDTNGTHSATAVWFNPNLDFAILRASNLAGGRLLLNTDVSATSTAVAVLGYPGGGGLQANPAAVIDSFTARGRNIYGKGATSREVYELRADIIPGNSGGPVVDEAGSVIGVVFAQSTSYKHVGYALTAGQVEPELHQAQAQNKPVSTGSCAE